jgi:ribosomal protein S18 acetylase RimI-like enzyme
MDVEIEKGANPNNRKLSPKLKAALLFALLSICVFVIAWNARYEPRHSLCPGDIPELQPIRTLATIYFSCDDKVKLEDYSETNISSSASSSSACLIIRKILEQHIKSIFYTSLYNYPIIITPDILSLTNKKQDHDDDDNRLDTSNSYFIPVSIKFLSSLITNNTVEINHNLASVDVFLSLENDGKKFAKDKDKLYYDIGDGFYHSIVIAVLLSAGAACNELPLPLIFEGLSGFPSTCEKYMLPSPPSFSSILDPNVKNYMKTKEYSDFRIASFEHSMNWLTTSSQIHIDTVLAHSPDSSSASTFLSLSDDVQNVFQIFQKLIEEVNYFSFTFSFRTSLFVNITRENEELIKSLIVTNGSMCQFFTLYDTDIETISSITQSSISRSSTMSTSSLFPPILYKDIVDNKSCDEMILSSSSYSSLYCFKNSKAPIPFKKRSLDGDLGRSALQLLYALRDVTSTTPMSTCSHQSHYLCSNSTSSSSSSSSPFISYCSSITPPSSSKIVFFVPSKEKSPLFFRSKASSSVPIDMTEINNACVSNTSNQGYIWPQKFVNSGLRTEAEIKSWGALIILNNIKEENVNNINKANYICSDSAKSAVKALRRRLGLTGRRIHRLKYTQSISTQDTPKITNVNTQGDIDTFIDKNDFTVKLLSSEFDKDEERLDGCAISSSNFISIPERRMLDRLWLTSHLLYIRRALLAACALDTTPRLTSPKRAQISAKLSKELYIESLTLLKNNRSSNSRGDAISLDSKIRAALSKARLARLLAENVAYEPDITSDAFMPLPHILALYGPMWAPMALPLLVAILQGISSFRRKKRKDAAMRSIQSLCLGKGVIECVPFDENEHTDAVRGLYVEGQVMHASKGEEAVMRHMWWTKYVLTGDLLTVKERYMNRDPAKCGKGSCFFVASISIDTLNSIIRATGSKKGEGENNGIVLINSSLPLCEKTTNASTRQSPTEDEFFTNLLSLRSKCAQRSVDQKNFNGPTQEELQELFQVPGGPFLSLNSKRVYIGTVAVLPVKSEEYVAAKLLLLRASGASDKVIESARVKALKEAPTVAEILRVAVSPLMRRCGVATALTTHAEGFARACGYKTAYLSTLGTMEGANDLYKKNGFTLLSNTPQGSKNPFPIGPEGHPQSLVQEIFVCEYEKKL